MGYVCDITDRKRMEARYRQSQKMEAVGQLAAGVAHDFTNLLTGITGFVQFAISDLPEDSTIAQDLRKASAGADRAAALTRQLLAFTRQQVMQPVPVRVGVVIEELTSLLRRVIPENIEPEITVSGDVGTVLADCGQLEQVLLNLVVNARDAMPSGGKLRIETESVALDEGTSVACELSSDHYTIIKVTDTGCGMDRHVKERIFDPFFTTKAVGEGTGLGLSTAYGIVKQHGGNITVTSAPGKGSTFTIYLPRADQAVNANVDPEEGLAPAGSETVLLVEDDEIVRNVAERVLIEKGYSVHVASSPAEAHELQAVHPELDLLVTDIVMPGQDGIAMYQEMVQAMPRLKVVLMTGYSERAISGYGALNLDVPLLEKPFTPEKLAQTVRQALEAA